MTNEPLPPATCALRAEALPADPVDIPAASSPSQAHTHSYMAREGLVVKALPSSRSRDPLSNHRAFQRWSVWRPAPRAGSRDGKIASCDPFGCKHKRWKQQSAAARRRGHRTCAIAQMRPLDSCCASRSPTAAFRSGRAPCLPFPVACEQPGDRDAAPGSGSEIRGHPSHAIGEARGAGHALAKAVVDAERNRWPCPVGGTRSLPVRTRSSSSESFVNVAALKCFAAVCAVDLPRFARWGAGSSPGRLECPRFRGHLRALVERPGQEVRSASNQASVSEGVQA
jgi:hypothetical protein